MTHPLNWKTAGVPLYFRQTSWSDESPWARDPRRRRLNLQALEDRAAPDTLIDLMLAGAIGGPVAALTLALGDLPTAAPSPAVSDPSPSDHPAPSDTGPGPEFEPPDVPAQEQEASWPQPDPMAPLDPWPQPGDESLWLADSADWALPTAGSSPADSPTPGPVDPGAPGRPGPPSSASAEQEGPILREGGMSGMGAESGAGVSPLTPAPASAPPVGGAADEATGGQSSVAPTASQDGADRVSIRSALGNAAITLDAHGYRLEGVYSAPAPAGHHPGVTLPYGLFGFAVTGVDPGGIATVDLTLPDGSGVDGYYKPDPDTGLLSRFAFNGRTGAVVAGNTVTLYLQDGGRGDDDGVVNGVIVDPGGPGGGTGVVISEAYTTGGQTGAALNRDFIELFNWGTEAVYLTNWNLRYTAAGSAGPEVIPLAGVIEPQSYYLVGAATGPNGSAIPTPDRTAATNLDPVGGTVELVTDTDELADVVGYGTAGVYEGSAPAAAPTATQSIQRDGAGQIDTDENGLDFYLTDPSPRNAASGPLVDTRPAVNITADQPEVTQGAGVTAAFTVSRTGSLSQPIAVALTVGGTAREGADFDPIPRQVTIPAGAAATQVSTTVIDDTWQEGDETISVALLSTIDYQLGPDDWASVVVHDETGNSDPEPIPVIRVTPTVSVTASPASIAEGGGGSPLTLQVTRTDPYDSDLLVPLTLGGTAAWGEDYTLPDQVVIPAGQASVTVELAPLDDDWIEGPETVAVSLVDAGVYNLGGSSVAVTLTDDATDAIPLVTMDALEAYVDEPAVAGAPAVVDVMLRRTGPVDEALTVTYEVSGSATNGTDYGALSGTATFAPGAATVTIPVAVLWDSEPEPLEEVSLTLTTDGGPPESPTGGMTFLSTAASGSTTAAYGLGSTSTGTIFITDLGWTGVLQTPALRVQSVDFKDALQLRDDPGLPGNGLVIPRPQWLDKNVDGVIQRAQGDRAFAIAYPQNQTAVAGQPAPDNTITVKVVFKVTNPAAFRGRKIMVQGWRVEGLPAIVFPAKEGRLEGTTVTVDNWKSVPNERGVIGFWDRAIYWSFAIDPEPNTPYQPAGMSANPNYATFKEPLNPGRLYRTVVHIGSVGGAGYIPPSPANDPNGYVAERELRDRIWTNWGGDPTRSFASRGITTWDGKPLHYYKKWEERDFQDRQLIATKDAQCSAWAMLFRDVMRAQGYGYAIWKIVAVNPRENLMVKNWTFPNRPGPYVNIVDAVPTAANVGGNRVPFSNVGGVYAYKFKRAEVTDANGIPGQNVANPASLFQNHVVVGVKEPFAGQLFDNAIYDPSYGAIYRTGAVGTFLQEMQSAAIAGFYQTTRDPMINNGYPMEIRKPDPGKTEISKSVYPLE